MKTTLQKMICLSICVAMLLVLFAGCGKEPVSSPTDITPESVVTPLEQEPLDDTTTTVSRVEASNPSSSKMPTSSVVSPPSSDDSSKDRPIFYPIGIAPQSTPSKEDPKPISIVFRSIYADQYTGETGMGKLWKDHFGKMAEQGIITSYANLDTGTAVDTIFKEVLAGRASADVYEVSLAMSHQLAVKKVLANLLDSKALNQKAFDNGGTHSNTINGKTYGVSLDTHADVVMVMYNKKFIGQYAPDTHIDQLVAQKKWNFDAFKELAKQCTKDTDGNGRSDLFGFVSDVRFIDGVVSANLGGYALMNQGKVEASVCNQEGVSALEFAKKSYKNDKVWMYKAKVEDVVTQFTTEKAAMAVLSSGDVLTVAPTLKFSYGVAPMPIGYDQTDYLNGVFETRVLVAPLTARNRLDDIGLWLNGVAKAKNRVFVEQTKGLNGDSVTMYHTMLNNTSPEYSVGAFTSEITSQIHSAIVSGGKKGVAYVMKAIKTHTQYELDEFYAPLYEK